MTVPAERPWFTTWSRVLDVLADLEPTDIVCFNGPEASADDRCVVCDDEDLGEDEDVPSEASAEGLTLCLLKEQIEDVVENVRLQVADPDPSTVYAAISYFAKNDAFLEI
jgi:hypothetical protein